MAGVTRDPTSGAIRLNLYATGAKHYGANGSTTATTGAVSKVGYRDRERRKKLKTATMRRRLAVAYDASHGLS